MTAGMFYLAIMAGCLILLLLTVYFSLNQEEKYHLLKGGN